MFNWKPFYDECARCGTSPVHVFTRCKTAGQAMDGDGAKCPECGLEGGVIVYEDNGNASVTWNDYDEEEKIDATP